MRWWLGNPTGTRIPKNPAHYPSIRRWSCWIEQRQKRTPPAKSTERINTLKQLEHLFGRYMAPSRGSPAARHCGYGLIEKRIEAFAILQRFWLSNEPSSWDKVLWVFWHNIDVHSAQRIRLSAINLLLRSRLHLTLGSRRSELWWKKRARSFKAEKV